MSLLTKYFLLILKNIILCITFNTFEHKKNTFLIYFYFISPHVSIKYNIYIYVYIYIYYLLITICTYLYIIISLHHILFTKYN